MKRQTSLRRAASLLGALILSLFACTAALGQAGTSSVRGTVLDAGRAVAGDRPVTHRDQHRPLATTSEILTSSRPISRPYAWRRK